MATADAVLKFTAEDNTKGGLGKIAGGLKSIINPATLAAGAIAGVTAAISSTISYNEEIQKMSVRTGLTSEVLSQMGFVMEQNGASIETFEKGITRMQSTLFDAEKGLAGANDALDALGVNLDDLKGKSPEEQFNILADAIAGVEDPGKQSALAMDVFGKAGVQLLPTLKSGSEGIANLRDEADSLGKTISTETAESAAEFVDNMGRMKTAVAGVAQQGVNVLLPRILELTDFITQKVIPAFQEHLQPILQNFAKAILPVLKQAWEDLQPGLQELFKVVEEKVLPALQDLMKFIKDTEPIWSKVLQVAITYVKTAFQALIETVGFVLETLSNLITFITAVFRGDWDEAWGAVKDQFSAVFEFISNMLEITIGNWLKLMNTFFGDIVQAVVDWVKDFVDAFSTLALAVVRPIVVFRKGVTSLFQSIWDAIVRGVGGFVNSVVRSIQQLPRRVLNVLRELLRNVRDLARQIASAAADAIPGGGIVKGAVGRIGSLFGGAEGAIVTKPTLTWVAEEKPEAVVPLSSAPGASPLGGLGTTVQVIVKGSILVPNLNEAIISGIKQAQKTGRI